MHPYQSLHMTQSALPCSTSSGFSLNEFTFGSSGCARISLVAPCYLHALQHKLHTPNQHTLMHSKVACNHTKTYLLFILPCVVLCSTSSGFSVKELTFGSGGRLEVSRVCRQMTAEERQVRLRDPSAAQPADVLGAVVPKLAKGAAAPAPLGVEVGVGGVAI